MQPRKNRGRREQKKRPPLALNAPHPSNVTSSGLTSTLKNLGVGVLRRVCCQDRRVSSSPQTSNNTAHDNTAQNSTQGTVHAGRRLSQHHPPNARACEPTALQKPPQCSQHFEFTPHHTTERWVNSHLNGKTQMTPQVCSHTHTRAHTHAHCEIPQLSICGAGRCWCDR